jgi:hypothetical protein
LKLMFGAIVSLVLVALPMVSRAAGDRIRFAQAGSGTISAVLTGAAEPCAGEVIFPMSVRSVDVSGNAFDITSFFAILDPATCPSPPQPYQVTASLGTLADGHYTVVWTSGSVIARGEFDVIAGALGPVRAVPALALPGQLGLFGMLALTGLALLRRRHLSRDPSPATRRGSSH